MRYRYYTCACMHIYLTYLREVGVWVRPLCSPVMFDLGVAHKPHNEDDGQKPAEFIVSCTSFDHRLTRECGRSSWLSMNCCALRFVCATMCSSISSEKSSEKYWCGFSPSTDVEHPACKLYSGTESEPSRSISPSAPISTFAPTVCCSFSHSSLSSSYPSISKYPSKSSSLSSSKSLPSSPSFSGQPLFQLWCKRGARMRVCN